MNDIAAALSSEDHLELERYLRDYGVALVLRCDGLLASAAQRHMLAYRKQEGELPPYDFVCVESLDDLAGMGAREAEGSRLLSGSVSDGRAGSNPAPSVFNPPYRYEVSLHGPATIYDAVSVGWVARVKESLPHKEALAKAITEALNRAAAGS